MLRVRDPSTAPRTPVGPCNGSVRYLVGRETDIGSQEVVNVNHIEAGSSLDYVKTG